MVLETTRAIALTRVTPGLASIERTCLSSVRTIRQMAPRRRHTRVVSLLPRLYTAILGKYIARPTYTLQFPGVHYVLALYVMIAII